MTDSERIIIVVYLYIGNFSSNNYLEYVADATNSLVDMFDDTVKTLVVPTWNEREHMVDVFRPKEMDCMPIEELEKEIKAALDDLKK